MTQQRSKPKRERLPTTWTIDEKLVLYRCGLLPYIPAGMDWPLTKPAIDDILSSNPSRIGDVEADLKQLALWIGIRPEQWKVEWWRWCFELRYGYAESSPFDLIGKEWGRRIVDATDLSLEQFTNDHVREVLDPGPDRAKCLRFLATELAHEVARSRWKAGSGEPELWKHSLSDPAFWLYLQRTRASVFGDEQIFRYIAVEDGTLEALIGKIIYLLQSAEDTRLRDSSARPAELVGVKGMPPEFDRGRMRPSQEFMSLVNAYESQPEFKPVRLLNLVLVWGSLLIDEHYRRPDIRINLVALAGGILEQLRPDIYKEKVEWVKRLRSEFARPCSKQGEPYSAQWLSKLADFKGALEHNPLLNIVLRKQVEDARTRRRHRSEMGRPADITRGKMCAYAVRLLRKYLPETLPVSINELVKGLRLTTAVRSSVSPRKKYSVYAAAAPLLASLLKSQVTPDQVKTNALRYDGALMADPWLKQECAGL